MIITGPETEGEGTAGQSLPHSQTHSHLPSTYCVPSPHRTPSRPADNSPVPRGLPVTRPVAETADLPAVPQRTQGPHALQLTPGTPNTRGTPSLWPHRQHTAQETRVDREEEHWTGSPLGPSLGLSRPCCQQSRGPFVHSLPSVRRAPAPDRRCAGRRASSSEPDTTPHLAAVTFQWKETDKKQNKQAGHVSRRRKAGLGVWQLGSWRCHCCSGETPGSWWGPRLFWA